MLLESSLLTLKLLFLHDNLFIYSFKNLWNPKIHSSHWEWVSMCLLVRTAESWNIFSAIIANPNSFPIYILACSMEKVNCITLDKCLAYYFQLLHWPTSRHIIFEQAKIATLETNCFQFVTTQCLDLQAFLLSHLSWITIMLNINIPKQTSAISKRIFSTQYKFIKVWYDLHFSYILLS